MESLSAAEQLAASKKLYVKSAAVRNGHSAVFNYRQPPPVPPKYYRIAAPQSYARAPLYAKLSLSLPQDQKPVDSNASNVSQARIMNRIAPPTRQKPSLLRQKSLPSLLNANYFTTTSAELHQSKPIIQPHIQTVENHVEPDGFWDSMGLSPAILHGLRLLDRRDEEGTLVMSSVPSSVYSPSKTDSGSNPEGDTRVLKSTPVSQIERNARVLKWMYSACNSY